MGISCGFEVVGSTSFSACYRANVALLAHSYSGRTCNDLVLIRVFEREGKPKDENHWIRLACEVVRPAQEGRGSRG
jgi:hypothetical protein